MSMKQIVGALGAIVLCAAAGVGTSEYIGATRARELEQMPEHTLVMSGETYTGRGAARVEQSWIVAPGQNVENGAAKDVKVRFDGEDYKYDRVWEDIFWGTQGMTLGTLGVSAALRISEDRAREARRAAKKAQAS